jgi:hypothetical protein
MAEYTCVRVFQFFGSDNTGQAIRCHGFGVLRLGCIFDLSWQTVSPGPYDDSTHSITDTAIITLPACSTNVFERSYIVKNTLFHLGMR